MDPNSTFNATFTNSSTNGTSDNFTTTPPKPFWTNLLLPVLYIAILVGSLLTFSSTYRKRQLAKQASLENWFPPHRQRDLYLSLLHLDPKDASTSENDKSLKNIPDSVLKAALLRRAVEDIERIVKLRASKPALQSLLQRGSVGDELWQRFLREEKEMEEEVKDVVSEVSLSQTPIIP
jgi:translocation protein SEC66